MNILRHIFTAVCLLCALCIVQAQSITDLTAWAKGGDVDAMVQLGRLYTKGDATVSPDKKQAVKWLEKALKTYKSGNVATQNPYLVCYLVDAYLMDNPSIKKADKANDLLLLDDPVLHDILWHEIWKSKVFKTHITDYDSPRLGSTSFLRSAIVSMSTDFATSGKDIATYLDADSCRREWLEIAVRRYCAVKDVRECLEIDENGEFKAKQPDASQREIDVLKFAYSAMNHFFPDRYKTELDYIACIDGGVEDEAPLERLLAIESNQSVASSIKSFLDKRAAERARLEQLAREREDFMARIRKPVIDLEVEDIPDKYYYAFIEASKNESGSKLDPVLKRAIIYERFLNERKRSGYAAPSPAEYGKTGVTKKKYSAPIFVKNSNTSYTYNVWSIVNPEVYGDDYSTPLMVVGLDNEPNASTSITITPKTIKFTLYEDCQCELIPAYDDPHAHVGSFSGVRKPADPYAGYECKSKIPQTGKALFLYSQPYIVESREDTTMIEMLDKISLEYTQGSCTHKNYWLGTGGTSHQTFTGPGHSTVLLPYKFYHVCTFTVDLAKTAKNLGMTPRQLALSIMTNGAMAVVMPKTYFYRQFDTGENAALVDGLARVFNITAEELQRCEFQQHEWLGVFDEDDSE